MAHKRLPILLAACSIAAAGLMLFIPPALSVHDIIPINTFELDGNVADSGAAGVDWSSANFGPLVTGQLAKTGVIADAAPATIFAGGGSKDDLDLNGPLSGAGGWKHKTGQVPDKDDITNAYASAHTVGGKLVVYAGADRFDNSGDAFMGFWFFQNQIGLGSGSSGGGSPFIGQHAFGDVLVLANFTGGGTTVNIEVLRWIGTVRAGVNPANIVNGTLERIAGAAGGTPATCIPGSNLNDLFCGITNTTAGETPNWTYLSKGGTSSFPTATFFEVGINISDVFAAAGAGTVPCFSSFMAETRSSSSISAVLKDFALGSFPVCGIAVTKQCINPVLASNTTVGYTVEGQVQNTGFGTVTNLQLTDSPQPLGAISYHACNGSGLPDGAPIGFSGSINPLQSVCYRSSFVTSANGASDTITATANAGATATVSAQATAPCIPLELSPVIDVTKRCRTTLDQVTPYLAVKVLVDGEVCNKGDTPLFDVTVTDSVISGNLLAAPNTLAVNECKSYSASYYPVSALNRLGKASTTAVPGLALFTDTVTATAKAALNKAVPPDSQDAECTLCPTCSPDACPGGVCPAATGPATTSTLIKRQQR